jgi:hypothetical protein
MDVFRHDYVADEFELVFEPDQLEGMFEDGGGPR